MPRDQVFDKRTDCLEMVKDDAIGITFRCL